MNEIICLSVSRRVYKHTQGLRNVCISTYLSFPFKSTVYNLLKLLDFVTADASKLISEFSVFIYERLDDIHLLI